MLLVITVALVTLAALNAILTARVDSHTLNPPAKPGTTTETRQ